MKKLLFLLIVTFGFPLMVSSQRIKTDEKSSKIMTEIFGMPIEEYQAKFGNVGVADLAYLFGDVNSKDQASNLYRHSLNYGDFDKGIFAAYRILELSKLHNGIYCKQEHVEAAEIYIKKIIKKLSKKDESYANLTQDVFFAKNNIQSLTQLENKATSIMGLKESETANTAVYNEPVKNQQTQNQEHQKTQKSITRADVDNNIPQNNQNNENTFVVIIANENYQEVAKVPYTINDGEIFAEYCKKTLGIPETNISFVKDATANNMKREIRWLTQILNQYKGEGKAILYYAGHGIPDESTKDAFLLPIDGYGDDPESGYSLNDLYKTLNEAPSKSTLVFLDACFSGSQRGEGMLSSARGVAIKAKPADPIGNMVVFSAASGDETAYPYIEKEHGLFTYYFLKKLQESKGNVTLGELSDYISDQVGKKSIIINRKSQTPTVLPSSAVSSGWRNWKLK